MRLNLPHFLFLNGPAGSGKSTLAKLICDTHPAAFRESFAEPIREMLYSVFFPDCLVDRPFNLRDQTVKGMPLTRLAKLQFAEEAFKGDSTTVREAMIGFSEDYMKKLFGPNIFGRLLFNRCVEQTQWYRHFIIDDSGFPDEAAIIVARVGADACHLVRLHRRGCDFSGDSRGYISLPRVQTLDLHNDGQPAEMLDLLAAELSGTQPKLESL